MRMWKGGLRGQGSRCAGAGSRLCRSTCRLDVASRSAFAASHTAGAPHNTEESRRQIC
jgi:hypothetical protein